MSTIVTPWWWMSDVALSWEGGGKEKETVGRGLKASPRSSSFSWRLISAIKIDWIPRELVRDVLSRGSYLNLLSNYPSKGPRGTDIFSITLIYLSHRLHHFAADKKNHLLPMVSTTFDTVPLSSSSLPPSLLHSRPSSPLTERKLLRLLR